MRVLLVMKDKRLREAIQFSLSSRLQAEITERDDVRAAISELRDQPHLQDLIIVEEQRELFNLFVYLKKSKLHSPTIVITEDESKTISTSNTENILGYALRTNAMEDIQHLIQKSFDGNLTQSDSEYCAIPTKLIERISPLRGDLYIRLRENKYVRLFSRRDNCTNADVEKYAKTKNIPYLYLKRRDTDLFLSSIHDDIEKHLARNDIKPEAADDLAMDIVDLVHSYVKRFGFSDKVLSVAVKAVSIMELAVSESPKLNSIFKRFQNKRERYVPMHSIVLAHVASAIATELQWNTKGTLFKLCMAAMLHDITIDDDALASVATVEELEAKRENFSSESRSGFLNHVTFAAQLIDKLRDVPSDVANIIVQHHERPDGSGFPRGLKASHISPLSSIFIVAHELVRKLMLNKTTFSMEEEFLNLLKHFDHGATFHEIINVLDPYNPEQNKKMFG